MIIYVVLIDSLLLYNLKKLSNLDFFTHYHYMVLTYEAHPSAGEFVSRPLGGYIGKRLANELLHAIVLRPLSITLEFPGQSR
jgi:hypothetical protein